MSFALIDAKRADVSVATACRVLGVRESGGGSTRGKTGVRALDNNAT